MKNEEPAPAKRFPRFLLVVSTCSATCERYSVIVSNSLFRRQHNKNVGMLSRGTKSVHRLVVVLAAFLFAKWLRAVHGWIAVSVDLQPRFSLGSASKVKASTVGDAPSNSSLRRLVDFDSCHQTLCRREEAIWSVLKILSSPTILACCVAAPIEATAFPLLPKTQERRQLELCLVSLLRVVYWATSVAQRLEVSISTEDSTFMAGADTSSGTSSALSYAPVPEPALRSAYLDARLGAKAVLTSRVGVGASYFAYTLAGLQLTGCLNDLEFFNPAIGATKAEFREALASLVEFDGMDSVLDTSPRSSLTLSQYDDKKRTFCLRVLRERVVPLGQKLLRQFPRDALDRAEMYVSNVYSNEIPPSIAVTQVDGESNSRSI